MSILSNAMEQNIEQGSMIRKMFEAGAKLRAEFGADKVCDFSIGNPDLAPPPCVATTLKNLSDACQKPASLGYMQNAGFDFARKTLANYLSKEQNVSLTENDVVLTCGAAGAMHVFFRTVLNPQDEVLGISPFFVEYSKYVDSHNGVFKPIPALDGSFLPDLDAIEKAINEKTRALIINSPNNPTGVIYPAETLSKLVEILEKASAKYGRMIYLVSDEPYRFLAYEDEVPSLLNLSANCVVLGSFSKNLSLAGERIGYIAISPLLQEKELLMGGLVQANRFLGYVNAPVIGQYLMHDALNDADLEKNLSAGKEIYRERRDKLSKILKDAGIEFNVPQGAFYFFIKSPVADERIFNAELQKELILAVPGRGFGKEGYLRLSFAVPTQTIETSAAGFKRAVERLKQA